MTRPSLFVALQQHKILLILSVSVPLIAIRAIRKASITIRLRTMAEAKKQANVARGLKKGGSVRMMKQRMNRSLRNLRNKSKSFRKKKAAPKSPAVAPVKEEEVKEEEVKPDLEAETPKVEEADATNEEPEVAEDDAPAEEPMSGEEEAAIPAEEAAAPADEAPTAAKEGETDAPIEDKNEKKEEAPTNWLLGMFGSLNTVEEKDVATAEEAEAPTDEKETATAENEVETDAPAEDEKKEGEPVEDAPALEDAPVDEAAVEGAEAPADEPAEEDAPVKEEEEATPAKHSSWNFAASVSSALGALMTPPSSPKETEEVAPVEEAKEAEAAPAEEEAPDAEAPEPEEEKDAPAPDATQEEEAAVTPAATEEEQPMVMVADSTMNTMTQESTMDTMTETETEGDDDGESYEDTTVESYQEDISLEPSIEAVEQDDSVLLGYYQPSMEEDTEEGKEKAVETPGLMDSITNAFCGFSEVSTTKIMNILSLIRLFAN